MLHLWFDTILGWLSFALCIVLLAKFIGRVSKFKNFNLILRKTHKPMGFAVIITGLMHGIFLIIKHPQAIIGNVTGGILLAVIILLAITYFLRKKLKSKWFLSHRILSILLIALLIVHIVTVYVCGHRPNKSRGHNRIENFSQSTFNNLEFDISTTEQNA